MDVYKILKQIYIIVKTLQNFKLHFEFSKILDIKRNQCKNFVEKDHKLFKLYSLQNFGKKISNESELFSYLIIDYHFKQKKYH